MAIPPKPMAAAAKAVNAKETFGHPVRRRPIARCTAMSVRQAATFIDQMIVVQLMGQDDPTLQGLRPSSPVSREAVSREDALPALDQGPTVPPPGGAGACA